MTKARSNAVAKAAKGDLTVGTDTNLSGILPVSATNGDTIVADASTSTGLRYTAGNPIPNSVLNSCYDIWQRGTSILATASTSAYQADRWQGFAASNNITVSRQLTGDSTNLPFIQYCARAQRTSGNASTGAFALSQSFESANSIPYAGKTVTLSFYARAGANYSATSNLLNASIITGTGTDQNLQNGYTGAATPLSQNATLTTTWQRFSYSATLAAITTELAVSFSNTPVGTASTNDYFEVTGVQIDIGSVALPFRTNGATIQGELAACQRYYSRVNGTTVGGSTWIIGHITGASPSYAIGCYHYPVEMRVAPTITQSGSVRVSSASTLNDFSSFAGNAAVKSLRTLYTPTSVTNGYACHIDFISTAFIEMSAEL